MFSPFFLLFSFLFSPFPFFYFRKKDYLLLNTYAFLNQSFFMLSNHSLQIISSFVLEPYNKIIFWIWLSAIVLSLIILIKGVIPTPPAIKTRFFCSSSIVNIPKGPSIITSSPFFNSDNVFVNLPSNFTVKHIVASFGELDMAKGFLVYNLSLFNLKKQNCPALNENAFSDFNTNVKVSFVSVFIS